MSQGGAPRPARGLWLKLLLSYLAIIAVGTLALWVAIDVVAPPVFDIHMRDAMGMGGSGGMMGQGAGPARLGQARSDVLESALTEAFRSALTQALLVASGVAALAALAASLFVAGRVVEPVQRLVTASRRLAGGHYAERVPVTSSDELGALGHSFNELAAALEATERRRLELIGDVAHELRTPVATLEGYLEGLLDGVVEPNERTWGRLHDEASRLRLLVSDLQELSRAEARQMSLSLRPVDPGDVVRAAIDRLDGQFAEKGLELRVDVADGLPFVQADADRAVQVLTNLLSNALRYTPAPGQVVIRVTGESGFVKFAVADTGLGLAPEDLAQVFERFFRVEKSRSRVLGGSGVGLTISRALVEAMQGRIWGESAGIGRGSTFAFTLPVAVEQKKHRRPTAARV